MDNYKTSINGSEVLCIPFDLPNLPVFYKMVKMLNRELGHGRKNWYVRGSKKIRQYFQKQPYGHKRNHTLTIKIVVRDLKFDPSNLMLLALKG